MSVNPVSRRREAELARLLELSSPGPVRPLRALAAALDAAPLGPAPDFQATLRTRLMAVAAVAPHQAASTSTAARSAVSWRSQRRVAAATGGMAVVVAAAGVGVAGEQSLPGEAFYGVKKATESVQLWAARGDVARGEQHLAAAETRLDEVTALLAGTRLGALGPGLGAAGDDRARLVAETLVEMDSEYRAGSTLLVKAWRDDADPAVLRTLGEFTARQHDRLMALMPVLPTVARTPAQASLDLMDTVSLRAGSLLAGVPCGQACDDLPGSLPGTPGAVPSVGSPVAPGGDSSPPPAVPGESATPAAPGSSQAPAAPGAPGAPTSPPAAPRPQGPTSPGAGDGDDVEDLLEVLVPRATRSPSPAPAGSPSTGPSGVAPGPVLPSGVLPSGLLPTGSAPAGGAPAGGVPNLPLPTVLGPNSIVPVPSLPAVVPSLSVPVSPPSLPLPPLPLR